jgi:hypothetical protein
MSDLQKRIDHLEEQAAQSELLSEAATAEELRIYNRRLANELREIARQLRTQMEERNAPE